MNSYDIVGEAVRKYWREHYPQKVIAFFYQKYERDAEWEWCEELIECEGADNYEEVIFADDFCEGQTCVKELTIVPFSEVTECYTEYKLIEKYRFKDLNTIKDHYTYDAQSRQAIEEMAELTQAINKFWRKEMNCGYHLSDTNKNKDYREHIAEEIADVYICLKQMGMFLNIGESIEDYIDYKIDRQLKRIRESD